MRNGTKKQTTAQPKKFKWVVEFTVDEIWVVDGFDLTQQVAKEMIGTRLGWAYENETGAKILKHPTLKEINSAGERETKTGNTVEFDTVGYFFSHGQQPRGYGSWAFGIDEKHPSMDKIYWVSGSMKYSEAKKVVKAEALRRASEAGATNYTIVVYPQP